MVQRFLGAFLKHSVDVLTFIAALIKMYHFSQSEPTQCSLQNACCKQEITVEF
jgi:hypothetical protein